MALQRLRRHNDAIKKYQRAVDLKRDLLTPELQSYFDRHHLAAPDRKSSMLKGKKIKTNRFSWGYNPAATNIQIW